jgi:signal transduction histidine kinase
MSYGRLRGYGPNGAFSGVCVTSPHLNRGAQRADAKPVSEAQHLDRLHLVLRGLGAGADPARLLSDVLTGALSATGAREGLVLRAGVDRNAVVATTGEVSAFLRETADAALISDRLQRRHHADSGVVAVAEPLRAGSRVVGALAVAGNAKRVDAAHLPLYGDATTLILDRRPPAGSAEVPEVLHTLAALGAEVDTYAVLSRIFDACQQLFGVASGFCALFQDSAVRVGHYRGIDHERLLRASRHPDFRSMLLQDELRVETAGHPVVAQLARLGEVAVCAPLVADGRKVGHLVLLFPTPPDAARKALLSAFAAHAASCLRTAELYRRVGDHEEQLTSIVHSMPNPVVVVDESARFVEVNGAAGELFRMASNFEAGQPAAGRLGNELLEAMLAEGADEGAAEVVLGVEEQRVYRATVRRVRSASGRTLGRVLVLDDLTGERQVDALKADFVAVIGHELRTPLTVMKGYLHTLTKRWATLADDKRETALGALQSNVGRLERLIEDLLFVSAIEQRRCRIELELHDLGALLAEQAADHERVVVRRPRRPVELELDATKVNQVVHHLLDNAVKHSEAEVVVDLVDKGDVVEVSVTDTGPGIYSGDIPHLFERFRQLDGTTTRAHGGVGVGLYLCKRIVEALGGRIWCESRLGVGSRFAFTLPKDAVAPEPVGGANQAGIRLP